MKKVLIVVGLLLTLYSCKDNSKDSARLDVRLVDKPARYDEVNVEIIGVSINYSDENNENGWQELETETGIYNLIDLTAGNDVLLVSNEIPSGTISQIRLLLGGNNSIVEDGDDYPLITPSGQSSGVKVKLNQSFDGGIDYTIILDFDVSKSIVDNPQKYILKPVIRASLEALNGAIEGTIIPSDINALIYAIQNQDTIASTVPDAAGKFMFRGIKEGVYTVSVDIVETETLKNKVIENVDVTIGNVTDLGELDLKIN